MYVRYSVGVPHREGLCRDTLFDTIPFCCGTGSRTRNSNKTGPKLLVETLNSRHSRNPSKELERHRRRVR